MGVEMFTPLVSENTALVRLCHSNVSFVFIFIISMQVIF